ncbi:MAG: EamA family transporter [Bacillota bacterium]|uniref:EamA family transporter n=1 Tax=unclassified Virgibacillus TaxID=2620237 RepID=UPI000EF4B507|nr:MULTISPECIES: EamA family transporter [unclassified Virgibacillus]MCC2249972.1 EamA family transporter [Virgibacillus sp. AGTR]MDY7044690.1 EamA family transporter [Virgibacillus sp. M23]QRZ18172.1 EamA family transporter [Virgibacillus sp. AGTR]
MGYLYILGTIGFTVYGQLILKWKIDQYGSLPNAFMGKINFLLQLLLNPWILSGLFSAFLAALCWMAAMTKFDISYAYPFMSLSFVLVFILSAVLFGEPVSPPKIVGFSLVIAGIIIMR